MNAGALFGALVLALGTPRAPGGDPQGAVTFSEHVAPIVFDNCTACHREGQATPFALTNYEEVRRRAKMMALVTEIRRMPPWPPVPGHGDFLGARVLTAEQIDTLRRWVEQDMPEGDPAALPPVPEFSDDWHLGPPDVVVRMPVGYPVPAGGPDINRDFWIPVGLDEDKWLVAVETRPGSAALHHIICTLDTDGLGQRAEETDGLPGFAGMQGGAPGSRLLMSGWAIGGTPTRLPPGIAYKIPKGSDMVLRSHIHPTGKAVVEQTALGLYFTDEPPTRTIAFLSLPPFAGMTAGIDIPPGAADFTVTDSFVLPVDAEMTNVYGHQHYLGRSVQMWGTFPDGRRESLFYVDEWDFNWQGGYQYVEPVRLPKGTRMSVELVYDNSSDNPSNPSDPPVRVTWGRQSTDEMGNVGMILMPQDEKDAKVLERAIAAHARASTLTPEGIAGRIHAKRSRLRAFDRNRDGRVDAAEIPEGFDKLIAMFDTDGDGEISESELALP